MINCKSHKQGTCTKGLFGGRPSSGICLRCKDREPRQNVSQRERIPVQAGLPRRAAEQPTSQWGPAKWAEIHRKTDADQKYIDGLIAFLASKKTCTCQTDASDFLATNPPRFGDDWFAWTVEFHNAVNRKLSRSEMTEEDARERWFPPKAAEVPPPVEGSLFDVFAAAYVISLKRTPERLQAFWDRFPTNWPYIMPKPFAGVDGLTVPRPEGWYGAPQGAVGCRASHLAIVRDAIANDFQKPILVMEDDCEFASDGMARIPCVIGSVLEWDLIYLGGQHLSAPTEYVPGLLRSTGTDRTHCLTIHPRYFRQFVEDVANDPTHIDHALRHRAMSRQFFAASPWIAVQAQNHSLIEGRHYGRREWNHAPPQDAAHQVFYAKIADRQRNPWKGTSCTVFYHIACMNHWRDIVAEQCEQLVAAGLNVVRACVLGKPDEVETVNSIAIAAGVTLQIDFSSDRLDLYELPTLQQVHRWAKEQATPGAALYIHTKGAGTPPDERDGPNKTAWRKLMMRAMVDDWRANVTRCGAADLVGVDWQDSPQFPHFAGNFWMARSDWLATLPDPADYQRSRPSSFTLAGHSWLRMFAEMWTGSLPFHHIESLVCRNDAIWLDHRMRQYSAS